LELFLQANGFGKQTQEAPGPRGSSEELVKAPPHPKGGGDTSGGMSYTERATTRTQCRKLTKFIRMVQYLFNDAIAQMVKYTTTRLLEVLDSFEDDLKDKEAEEAGSKDGQPPAAAPSIIDKKPIKKPNFNVECIMDTAGLHFDPAGALIRDCLKTCLQEALRTTSNTKGFLAVDDFLPFTQPLAELGDGMQLEEQQQDLYGIITQDPKFREFMTKITVRYDSLFQRVKSYGDGFQRFVKIFAENAQLMDPKETFKDSTLDEFRVALATYKTQKDDIKAIPKEKDIGLFRVDCRRMQETLLPSPTRCLSVLAEYIPALAMQKQAALSEEMKVANEKLSQYPSNVDDYVQFNINLNKIDAAMPAIEQRYLEIQEMKEVIQEYAIRIDQEARNALGALTAARKTMVDAVSSGKDRAESDVTFFSKALEQDIPELKSRVNAQSKQLQAADFKDVSKMGKEHRAAVLEMIDALDKDVKQSIDDASRFNRYQDVLKMEVTPFEEADDLKANFQVCAALWRGIDSWEGLQDEWLVTSFAQVPVEVITKKVQEYNKLAVKAQKGLEGNEIPTLWGTAVTKFKNTLPVVIALRNKALKPRHWEEITKLIGQELALDDEAFTLGKLLEMGVDEQMEPIQEISGRATAELALEEMLDKVKKTWDDQELIVNSYKDSAYILGSVEDITVALEDSLVNISTIAGSRFVGPIRNEVEEWQKNLLLFQETLDEWLMVQKNWMYLESIFGAGDIKKQLPTESARFQDVDSQFRTIMKETFDFAVALRACTKPGRLEVFQQANETLDQIQKSLEDYLLSKCVAFPRFFFLSNDELLEILSQQRNPKAVQPHLRKCFDNLVKLRFTEGNEITAMMSAENEEIPFVKPLKARGNVEKWLSADGGVEDFMFAPCATCKRKAISITRRLHRERIGSGSSLFK
jgi:dynein heavy chain